MREIKFRAWEPDLEKFYYFDLYTLYCINPMITKAPKPDEDNAMVLFNINNRPQEQFTGLKDKNGKEIYEGDIVKLCRSLGYQSNKGDIGYIKYDESELGYLIFKNYSISKLTTSRAKYIEVISNVHENPEFLGEQ